MCLCFIAQLSLAETIDSYNAKWTGTTWQINQLNTSALVYQQVFYPLVTQGPGAFPLNPDGFVLKVSIFITTNAPDQEILHITGRITDDKDSTLTTLAFQGGKLVWVCPVNQNHDSLFDAPQSVNLMSTAIRRGEWLNTYTLAQPGAFQQTFGWKKAANAPLDPQKTTVLSMARQLSPAAWELKKVEISKLNGIFIGCIEMLPTDAEPVPAQNIRKGSK